MEESTTVEKQGTALVFDENGKSKISANRGLGIIINTCPNMNLVFPNVCIPAIRFDIRCGKQKIETKIETQFTNQPIEIGYGNCYILRD